MINEVELLRPPREDVVAKLRELLAEAEAGNLRGLMFALSNGPDDHGFGHVGEWDLSKFAVGVKLLDVALTRLVIGESERTE